MMKFMAELIPTIVTQCKQPSNGQPQPATEPIHQLQAARRILYFFERLQALYGRRYHATFNTPEREAQAKKEWSPYIQTLNKVAMDSGFEQAKQKAIDGEKSYQWPNIPDIIRLCKPSLSQLGLSDITTAFNEACQHAHEPTIHQWSHQAVYLAGKQTGWHTLRCDSHLDRVRKQFAHDYQGLCNRLLAGHSIDNGGQLAITQQSAQARVEQRSQAKQRQLMHSQGIDPNGGRAEFLKSRRQLLNN